MDMKKLFIFNWLPLLFAAAIPFSFTACSSSDDETAAVTIPVPNPIEKEYFGINGANFVKGEMPESTDAEIAQGATLEENVITIASSTQYSKFYVSVNGIDGYYEIPATETTTTRSDIYTYKIILEIKKAIKEIEIALKGETTSGIIKDFEDIYIEEIAPSKPVTETDKGKLEQVGIALANELKANEFENLTNIVSQIVEKYTSESYNNTALEIWADDCLARISKILVDTEEQELIIGNQHNYITTDFYRTIYKASNFVGDFTAKDNGWKYTEANYLQFSVKDNTGANCIFKIETSGNEKKVYLGTSSKEESWLNFDNSLYPYIYKYYRTIENNEIYTMVPEVINFTFTRNGITMASLNINTDLSSMAEEIPNLNSDRFNANIIGSIGSYTFTINKLEYLPNAQSKISFALSKNFKPLISVGIQANTKIVDNDVQEVKNAEINLDIMNQVQIKGTCSNVLYLIRFLEKAQENEYDKEEFGNYLNQANDLLNLDMYYGIIKAAAIKLARFENDGCYYYTPIIIFSDDSSYSFEEFFTESNFKNLLGTVETILKEYEEMYQNTIND